MRCATLLWLVPSYTDAMQQPSADDAHASPGNASGYSLLLPPVCVFMVLIPITLLLEVGGHVSAVGALEGLALIGWLAWVLGPVGSDISRAGHGRG